MHPCPQVLLDAGAPVDQAAASGATAAYLATTGGSVHVLQRLLERRANPNEADAMGLTLLHRAVQVCVGGAGGGRSFEGTGGGRRSIEGVEGGA